MCINVKSVHHLGSAGKGGKIKREPGQVNANSSKSRLSSTSVTSASRYCFKSLIVKFG